MIGTLFISLFQVLQWGYDELLVCNIVHKLEGKEVVGRGPDLLRRFRPATKIQQELLLRLRLFAPPRQAKHAFANFMRHVHLVVLSPARRANGGHPLRQEQDNARHGVEGKGEEVYNTHTGKSQYRKTFLAQLMAIGGTRVEARSCKHRALIS